MVRLEAQAHGRVTGVGFRWFVTRAAESLSITGTVRNQSATCVEVVAFGPHDKVMKLLQKLNKGPVGSRVDHVKHSITDVESSPYDEFNVKY